MARKKPSVWNRDTSTHKAWGREYHEQFAVEAIESATREIRWTEASGGHHPGPGRCHPSTAYAVIRANKDIARARAHLASIGPREGKRTRRIWSALSKVERRVQASNYVAKCMGK